MKALMMTNTEKNNEVEAINNIVILFFVLEITETALIYIDISLTS